MGIPPSPKDPELDPSPREERGSFCSLAKCPCEAEGGAKVLAEAVSLGSRSRFGGGALRKGDSGGKNDAFSVSCNLARKRSSSLGGWSPPLLLVPART